MTISAVQMIRRMSGGSQAQLMLADDSRLWVVKFRNNPQGERVLINEMIATAIACAVGLNVPLTRTIEVPEILVHGSPEMWVSGPHGRREPCVHGPQLGSLYVGGLMPGLVLDFLPEEMLAQVQNLCQFAGMLCVDKWTGNVDGRQAVFSRKPRQRSYIATFIDQGFCFKADDWTRVGDEPLRGVYRSNRVYEAVTGWDSFEPWLSRLEDLDAGTLHTIAETVPAEWQSYQVSAMERRINWLLARQHRIRQLISDFRNSDRFAFPNWGRVVPEIEPSCPKAKQVAAV